MEFHGELTVSPHFGARCLLTVDEDSRDRVLCVVKATWSVPFGGVPEIVGEAPVRDLQERWEESPRTSIRLPADIAPNKPGTELLLVGHARKPMAFADARYVDVTLGVHGAAASLFKKTLRVHGPRTWQRRGDEVVPSSAELFEDTPLRWEWAYGGADKGGARDPRNPIGRGFARDRAELVGQACHRIEAAAPKAGRWEPVGFGALSASQEPRLSRRGSVGEDWTTSRAPRAPEDRHPRFHCVAPDDQWLAEPLRGDERFVISGVHPTRAWEIQLPRLSPEIRAHLRGHEEPLRTHLDTVLFDADHERVELIWRASFPLASLTSGETAVSVRPRSFPQAEQRLVA